MEFRNHTPFPGLAFQGVDQRSQAFHVAVLRQTLTWNDAATMRFADEQLPLCDADLALSPDPDSPVLQESDLCHFKPRCDVIVNATGYAPSLPTAAASRSFLVGLRVSRADELLINKALRVHGPRDFVRARNAESNHLEWRLSPAGPIASLALDLRSAWGGACRVDAGTPAGQRFLDDAGLKSAAPDGAPLKWEHCAENAAGRGFTRDWYLKAAGVERVPAPQVETIAQPTTVRHLDAVLAGDDAGSEGLVAGLGVRPKGHPARAALVGTVDEAFISGEDPLPADFDFAVWNAAWPDQQVDELHGDEVIELVNLAHPRDGALQRDANGNSRLALRLPGHRPFVFVRFESGAMGELAARLDTVIVEPDRRLVHLVWRAVLGTAPGVRVIEYRMLDREALAAPVERDADRRAGGEGVAHGG